MDTYEIASLSLLQGLTEFLPISSSAHLVLVPKLTQWKDQGLAFDVAVHVGSLVAVVCYFRNDLGALLSAAAKAILAPSKLDSATRQQARLAGFIGLATIPICVVGPLVHDFVAESTRSYGIIAATTIGYGVLLGMADLLRAKSPREESGMSWWDALWIGLAQALAPIPGTSRSGVTMTAGLLLGLSRSAAARFSFLMSVPTITLVGAYQTMKLLRTETTVDWWALGFGATLSCLAAYSCIHLFLKLIDRIGLIPFVAYRIVLGIVLIVLCFQPDPAVVPPADDPPSVAPTTTSRPISNPATQASRRVSGVSRTS